MFAYILSLLFLMLASICNSIMDKTSHHFHKSVFKKMKNSNWWNPTESWKLKYVDGIVENGRVKWNILGFKFNKPVQVTDAWHFFKSLMIIFMCTSIVLMTLSLPFTIKDIYDCMDYVLNFILHLLITGFIWNKTFTLFYHKIWEEK